METLLYRINFSWKSGTKNKSSKDIKDRLRKELRTRKRKVSTGDGQTRNKIDLIYNQILVYTSQDIDGLKSELVTLLSEIVEERVITPPKVEVYNCERSGPDDQRENAIVYFGVAVDWLFELETKPFGTLKIKLPHDDDNVGDVKLNDDQYTNAGWYQRQKSLSFTLDPNDNSYLATIRMENNPKNSNSINFSQTKFFMGHAKSYGPPLVCILEPVHERKGKLENDDGLVVYKKSQGQLWINTSPSPERRDRDWYKDDGKWFDVTSEANNGNKLFSFSLQTNTNSGHLQWNKPTSNFFLEVKGFAIPDVRNANNRDTVWMYFDSNGKPLISNVQPKSDVIVLKKKSFVPRLFSKTFKLWRSEHSNRSNEGYFESAVFKYDDGHYEKSIVSSQSSEWYLPGSRTVVQVVRLEPGKQEDDYKYQDAIPYSAVSVRPENTRQCFGYIDLRQLKMKDEIWFSTTYQTSENIISLKWLDTLIHVKTETGYSGIATYYSDWIKGLRCQITAPGPTNNRSPIIINKDASDSIKLEISSDISARQEFFLGPLLVCCHIGSGKNLGDKQETQEYLDHKQKIDKKKYF